MSFPVSFWLNLQSFDAITLVNDLVEKKIFWRLKVIQTIIQEMHRGVQNYKIWQEH